MGRHCGILRQIWFWAWSLSLKIEVVNSGVVFRSLLERRRVAPVYRRRLDREYSEFCFWLTGQGIAAGWERNTAWANDLVVDYLHLLYNSQISFSRAKHAAIAIQTKHHRLRGKLHLAWDALRTWKSELPNRHRLPIPLEVVQSLFIKALDMMFGTL